MPISIGSGVCCSENYDTFNDFWISQGAADSLLWRFRGCSFIQNLDIWPTLSGHLISQVSIQEDMVKCNSQLQSKW